MEKAALAIFLLTWEIIQVSLPQESLSWVWKVDAGPVFTHLVHWAVFAQQLIRTNMDRGSVWGQPLCPHLISPGGQPSALVWCSPFRISFISNPKWSCVVQWSLIFLIVDSRVSCWFSVSVLYFAFLICSQLTVTAFILGRREGLWLP